MFIALFFLMFLFSQNDGRLLLLCNLITLVLTDIFLLNKARKGKKTLNQSLLPPPHKFIYVKLCFGSL